jgi:hypothetical protein
VTSPPYPDARTVEQYGGAVFDTSLEGYSRFGAAIFEALMPGGVVVLNIDGPIRHWRRDVGTERSLISAKVAIDWTERIGFRYIEHLAYVRAAFPTSAGPRWKSGWEPVHVFARPDGPVYFDRWASTRAAKHAGSNTRSAGCRRKGERRRSSLKKWVQPARRCLSTAETYTNNQGSTDRDHPAPFSREFAEDLVLCYSAVGEIVGDPLVGSGTVAIVANKHRRRFVGGDLGKRQRDDRPWADIARSRVSQVVLDFGEALLVDSRLEQLEI